MDEESSSDQSSVKKLYRCTICELIISSPVECLEHLKHHHKTIDESQLWHTIVSVSLETNPTNTSPSNEILEFVGLTIVRCNAPNCNAGNLVTDSEPFCCWKCDGRTLDEHLEKPKKPQKYKLTTTQLQEIATTKSVLTIQQKVLHKKLNAFQCLLCGVSGIFELEEHLLEEHSNIDSINPDQFSLQEEHDRVDCLVCGSVFFSIEDITNHFNIHRTDIVPEVMPKSKLFEYISLDLYKCTICKMNGITESNFDRHRTTHDEEEEEECDFELVASENSRQYVKCIACDKPYTLVEFVRHLDEEVCGLYNEARKASKKQSPSHNYCEVVRRFDCDMCYCPLSQDLDEISANSHLDAVHEGCTLDDLVTISETVTDECLICGHLMIGGFIKHMKVVHLSALCDADQESASEYEWDTIKIIDKAISEMDIFERNSIVEEKKTNKRKEKRKRKREREREREQSSGHQQQSIGDSSEKNQFSAEADSSFSQQSHSTADLSERNQFSSEADSSFKQQSHSTAGSSDINQFSAGSGPSYSQQSYPVADSSGRNQFSVGSGPNFGQQQNSMAQSNINNQPYRFVGRQNIFNCKICHDMVEYSTIPYHLSSKHPGVYFVANLFSFRNNLNYHQCLICFQTTHNIVVHFLMFHQMTVKNPEIEAIPMQPVMPPQPQPQQHAPVNQSQLFKCEMCIEFMEFPLLQNHLLAKHPGMRFTVENFSVLPYQKFGNFYKCSLCTVTTSNIMDHLIGVHLLFVNPREIGPNDNNLSVESKTEEDINISIDPFTNVDQIQIFRCQVCEINISLPKLLHHLSTRHPGVEVTADLLTFHHYVNIDKCSYCGITTNDIATHFAVCHKRTVNVPEINQSPPDLSELFSSLSLVFMSHSRFNGLCTSISKIKIVKCNICKAVIESPLMKYHQRIKHPDRVFDEDMFKFSHLTQYDKCSFCDINTDRIVEHLQKSHNTSVDIGETDIDFTGVCSEIDQILADVSEELPGSPEMKTDKEKICDNEPLFKCELDQSSTDICNELPGSAPETNPNKDGIDDNEQLFEIVQSPQEMNKELPGPAPEEKIDDNSQMFKYEVVQSEPGPSNEFPRQASKMKPNRARIRHDKSIQCKVCMQFIKLKSYQHHVEDDHPRVKFTADMLPYVKSVFYDTCSLCHVTTSNILNHFKTIHNFSVDVSSFGQY